MFTDANIFTVILLMDPSLRVPTPVRTSLVPSTRTKAARLAHKPKRGERCQPGEPFWRIRRDQQFSFLWTDQHISVSGSLLDQRDEWRLFLGRMTHKGRHLRLLWHARRRARKRSQSIISDQTELSFESLQALLGALLPLAQ
jgi:hypothetical protein